MLERIGEGHVMDKNIIWAWAIKNSICVICWTVLAIVFNKWWVSLFGLLFMSSIAQKYNRVCDKCGRHSPYADSYNEALDKAKEAGWIHYIDSNTDYCPECRGNMYDL